MDISSEDESYAWETVLKQFRLSQHIHVIYLFFLLINKKFNLGLIITVSNLPWFTRSFYKSY